MISQHPQVAVASQKELHFFDKVETYAEGLAWYREQFAILPTTRAVGEFTPNYLWTTNGVGNRDLPKLVHDACPDLEVDRVASQSGRQGYLCLTITTLQTVACRRARASSRPPSGTESGRWATTTFT